MTKYEREMQNIALAAGLTNVEIVRNRKHLRVVSAEGFVTLPGTPGDCRNRKNARALMRRLAAS